MSKKRLVIKQTNPLGIVLIVLFAIAFLAGIALLAFAENSKPFKAIFSYKEGFIFYEASTSKNLKKDMHLYGLCNTYSDSVQPYLLKRFPKDFSYLPSKMRKKMFVAAMLPIALTVKKRFEQEHRIIKKIKEKIDNSIALTVEDRTFLKNSMKTYRAKDIDELLKKVDSVPVSLLIAQAGIESGWGKSRFAILYNNIYGIHRKHRKPYQPIVLSFNNLYDATVYYVRNLNTSSAYREFRNARYLMGQKRNPYKLAEYLTMYSTQRHRYIKLVQNVLSSNKLSKYDRYNIQTQQVMADEYINKNIQ